MLTGEEVVQIDSEDAALSAARRLGAEWSETITERDRLSELPVAELEALRRSGLLGISIPRAYGGAGVTVKTVVTVFRLLAQIDGGLAQIPQNHFDFVDALGNAQEEVKKFFYSQVLRGARFGNALAEKGRRGSTVGTVLKRVDGGYLVTGEKSYATGALTADWVPVTCQHPDGRMLVAYVDRKAAGLTVDRDWNAFGQRVTYSGSVHLKDVWVPERHVVDRWGDGWLRSVALGAGNQAIHAAIEVGIAEGSLLKAVEVSRAGIGRTVLLPTARPPAELAAELAVAWSMVEFSAIAVDRAVADGTLDSAIVAHVAVEEAKGVAYEVVPRLSSEALGLTGRSGVAAEQGFDRFWRNARTHSLHDPGRWRRYYAGNYFLNGILSEPLATRIKDRATKPTQNV